MHGRRPMLCRLTVSDSNKLPQLKRSDPTGVKQRTHKRYHGNIITGCKGVLYKSSPHQDWKYSLAKPSFHASIPIGGILF